MRRFDYIRKVSIASAENLAGAKVLPNDEIVIPKETEWEDLPLVRNVKVSVTDKISSNERIYTSTISFVIGKSSKIKKKRMTLMLQAVNGEKYIVGINERPFPVITTTEDRAEATSTANKTTVNITWTGALPPLLIV
jgi:hypothetical protein